jgi:cobalt-zinc-cadmium efflux system protein
VSDPAPHLHAHTHTHAHAHTASVARLKFVLVLLTVFLVAEVVGGVMSNSLALLADAGHMLTDVAALGLSLFVAWFCRQPETPNKTFGYLRLEILAALLNGATLLVISAWIIFEAAMRLRHPEAVAGGLFLIVAALGLAVNVASAWILHPDRDANLNLRGAYLHVLGDLLASVGTLAAAAVIRLTGWYLADPIAGVLTALLILRGSWQLVRESVDILLEATPSHIPLERVRAQLEAIPGMESVHDLHVWTVASGTVAMSAHAIVREPERQQHVLEHIHDAMRLFGIDHVTVQLERREMYEREAHLHA